MRLCARRSGLSCLVSCFDLASLHCPLRSLHIVVVTHLESSISLVRLPQMASMSPERHHHQASLRQAELNNLRKPQSIFNHPVPVIGCPVWVHVRDADILRHLRYLTSFRSVYALLPNSHSLRYHPRNYPRERCGLYRLGHLPHHHDAFLRHQYRMPTLSASGQIGLQCHRSTAYKLRIPSGITNPERIRVLLATLPRRTRLRATMRRSPRIPCLVAAARSYGLNDDGCFGSLWMEPSRHTRYTLSMSFFFLTSTYCDTSSDARSSKASWVCNMRRLKDTWFFLSRNLHQIHDYRVFALRMM